MVDFLAIYVLVLCNDIAMERGEGGVVATSASVSLGVGAVPLAMPAIAENSRRVLYVYGCKAAIAKRNVNGIELLEHGPFFRGLKSGRRTI